MDLITEYNRLINEGYLQPDKSQEIAISELYKLGNQFMSFQHRRKANGQLFRLFRQIQIKSLKPQNKGLYMFGGVGTGKSMLMDLFFESINNPRKIRVHFHAFMYEFHEKMRKIRPSRRKNPVRTACQEILKDINLLCFDEFQVVDITDAMIIGRVFEELFSSGITVLTTSNFHPEELYKDGLNRGLFLPFIRLLVDNLKILEVNNLVDYRTKKLREGDSYFCKEDNLAIEKFDQIWEENSANRAKELVLHYHGRILRLKNFVNGACRISFQELCEQSLSAVDYLHLCTHVKLLLLENIPVLNKDQNDAARRFILLIDTIYEANVRIVCLAAVEPVEIYRSGKFKREFARTVSRINEMRGDDWQKNAREMKDNFRL